MSHTSSKAMETDTPKGKRKQEEGSSGVSPDLKKHYPETSTESLGAIPEIDPPTRDMIINCVADCFNNDAFIKKISPTIVKLSQTLTNAAINDAVTKAVTQLEKDVVKPLQKENGTLKKAIDEKDKTITEKEAIIQAKDELLSQKADTINNLELSVSKLTSKLDDLEQYGRRCSVRMFNVPQHPGEPCTNAALRVITELLEIPLSDDDVERCHNLGRPNAKGNRPIIMKFKSYKSKAAVFHAKSKLKKNPNKIFITEDLTMKNHSLVQKLVQLRKDDSIDSFWTNDGKINVKLYEISLPTRVNSLSEIEELLPKPPSH